MQSLLKTFVVAILFALPSISLGQEAYSLPAGGGEQPMSLLTNFAEDVARSDLVGGIESGTELLAMTAAAVASDPRTHADGYLTAEQIVRLYLEAYPKDPLYFYFKDGGGKVLIKSFSWGAAYWSYHWKQEIHFDDSWADTEENRKEAVRHLRNHLLEMADESGSVINEHLATWDGDLNKFFDKMAAEGIPAAVIFSPKQMTSTELERLNEGIANSVKLVPYFGGYVMTFELASGQVLSFTVYGQRELTTTEKWIIVGTPAAGYVAGMLVKVGGKWVFHQFSKHADDLATLASRGGVSRIGHAIPWDQMTNAQRRAFQHSYSRHAKELGLPNWSQKNAESLRQQFNNIVGHIRYNGTKIANAPKKPFNGKSVDVNFYEATLNGTRYYYYETLDGIFISAGRAK